MVKYVLDKEKIAEEEKYDGYYAVATNLQDTAKDTLAVSHRLDDQGTHVTPENLITTLKKMNVTNIHDVEYMALYNGIKTLDALTRLTALNLDKLHYKPKELNGEIKIY